MGLNTQMPPKLSVALGKKLLWLSDCCSVHEAPSEKGSTIKGKELAPKGSKFFSLRVDPFSEIGSQFWVTSAGNISIPLKVNILSKHNCPPSESVFFCSLVLYWSTTVWWQISLDTLCVCVCVSVCILFGPSLSSCCKLHAWLQAQFWLILLPFLQMEMVQISLIVHSSNVTNGFMFAYLIV